MTAPKTFNFEAESPEQQRLALGIQTDVQRGIDYLNASQADRAAQAFKLGLEKADGNEVLTDVLTHNLLTAYRQHIQHILEGKTQHTDVTVANPYIKEAASLQITGPMKNDIAFRRKFADTLKNLGMDLYFARQYESALFFFRKAIAVAPCPSYYVDLTNALAFVKTKARLVDYTTDYLSSELGTHIFIACAPKSGSTFLKNLLVSVTNFKDLFSVFAGLQNEHDIDLPQFAKFGNVNTVTQQHARASEANIQIMQAFRVRPIILVRNIYDTLMSLVDFYTKGFTFSTFFDKEEFLSFSHEKKLDLLIEFAIPWYFQFVASWQRAEREGRIAPMWLTYEDMISDKVGSVERIFDFYGMSVKRDIIAEKVGFIESESDKNRFNKGIAGRGKTGINNELKARVQKLGEFFPSADFSVIGLYD